MSKGNALILPPILGLDNDYSFIEELHNRTWENGSRPMYTEKVSIIIPVYNRKEKLAKTIAALSHQTYPHELFEVIIADDGSSDNPHELCETFKDYFSISYIRQEDMGYRLSEIRNKGIAAATHQQIIILDCDMLPLPTLVESYMKYAHVSDKVVLIGGRRYVNTDNVSFQEIINDISSVSSLPSVDTATGKVPTSGLAPTEDWRYKIYRTTNNLKSSKYPFGAFCGGNVCFHKSLISAVGGFDEDFKAWGAEDTEFGYRVYNHGYWFVPVHGANALHQEPPGGSNETDRDAGKSITQPILVEKCPSRYRNYEKNRRYEVPKVSVFIPAYNCEDFIEDAIYSVINQTYTDLEILVTDDGGTDNTANLVKQMAERDSRIRFFPKLNGGIGSACNHMLSFAKGEYALQLDGDDVLAPDTVEKMVEILDNSPIGFVYGDAFLVNRNLKFSRRSYSWSNYDRQKMIDGGMHVHPPRMFRMRDFNRTPKYDEELENAVDFDFFLKLAEVSDGYHYQRGLYLYRKHGSNTSDVRADKQTENTQIAITNSVQRLGISNLVNLVPDTENPRRLHVNPRTDMSKSIECTEFFRRFGIKIRSDEKFNIHELERLCDPSIMERISRVTATSSKRRRIRIGPFNDPSELLEAREKIKTNRGWNIHHQSVSTEIDSDLILVTGHFANESSSQHGSAFLRNQGLPTEIVIHQGEHPFAYPSIDTVEKFDSMVAQATYQDGKTNRKPKAEEPGYSYDPQKRWHFESGRLWLTYNDTEIWFEMPKNWKFEETHPDLFKLAEFVLLSPYEPNILDDWEPSRKAGLRPGLAFSAGIDSTAAMCLMPENTLLFYHERSGIDSILSHDNANRFINYLIEEEGRPVIRVKSNHEISRTIGGKTPGFSTDYACAVHVILLADYYDLDSIGTGMPLENSYMFHGQRFRDFKQTNFWHKHSSLFESVGLPLYQPVMGCSELINRQIVESNGYGDLAQSCLRSSAGNSCGKCWKCFRKNTLIGKPFEMSNEIKTFLAKKPLKMAASTLYSIQKLNERKLADEILSEYPYIAELMERDVSFLEGYYPDSIDLIPERYRELTKILLSESASRMENVEVFENFKV